jgi:photosystem II stability/assembly factor-like uncharacterized protein
MKKIILTVIAAAISCTITFSQGWQWQNPLPTGNKLNCVRFVDDNIGFAVGDCGTILKTTDGGETWTLKTVESKYMLKSVFFTDTNTGYIVGGENYDWMSSEGIILKTVNNGESWIVQNIFENIILSSIYFTDDNTGYAVGFDYTNDCAIILKTTNGGTEWIIKNLLYGMWSILNSVYFTDYNTGYAVGGEDYYGSVGVVIKTTDGGENWTIQLWSYDFFLPSIYFTNDNTGYVVGYGNSSMTSIILMTSDGGENWTNLPVPAGIYELSSVYFTNENMGYATGVCYDWPIQQFYGGIIKTTDGGVNWTLLNTGIPTKLFSVFFRDEYNGYVVGGGIGGCPMETAILKTTNGGENWTNQVTGLTEPFSSVFFLNENTGYAASGNPIAFFYTPIPGSILKTTDGGANWISKISGITDGIASLYFVDENLGYAVGHSTFLKTTDGGDNWIYLNTTTGNSIFFIDANTGYCAGDYEIQKTTNGGSSWISKTSGQFNSIIFLDESTGYATGQYAILKTTDAGENWTVKFENPYAIYGGLKSIYFVDMNTGYAVSGDAIYFGGSIFKTIDGGENWIELQMGLNLYSIYFTDENKGFVVGRVATGGASQPFYGGVILKTFDGGLNWTTQYTSNHLYSTYFIDGNTGYAVGDGGTILKYTGGGCYPEGIAFTSQAEIDNFHVFNSSCTEIEGYLYIHGNDITNLNGLNQITSISGDLIIGWSSGAGNPSLTEISGLENLTSIGGNFYIWSNQALQSLSGLSSLASVGANLHIGGNSLLNNINSLSNLTSIGGDLNITWNPNLTSLAGLENIESGSIENLGIYFNESLTYCDVWSICSYFISPNGTIEIHDNASGCDSQEEVELHCQTLVEEIKAGKGIEIIPNPSNDLITISSSAITGNTILSIFNVSGQKVIERQLTDNETQIDISALQRGVYFVRVQNEKMVEVGKMVKE